MKGIVLAGGSGTRLYPLTTALSKQLLPIYNKPMIYYPLSVLMLAEIRDILIITTQDDIEKFKLLLGDGSNFGINLTYIAQEKPYGIAHAFILAKDFIGRDSVSLVLGDNFFYGHGLSSLLIESKRRTDGALIFAYKVKNPSSFGIVEFDNNLKVISIEEKPENPKSTHAITGLYFYDNLVTDIAKDLKPSSRGELEITDINNIYLKNKRLKVEILGRGFTWLDTGSYDGLLEASQFVQTIENRQGYMIACLEEIAFLSGWISESKLLESASKYSKTSYGNYLLGLVTK